MSVLEIRTGEIFLELEKSSGDRATLGVEYGDVQILPFLNSVDAGSSKGAPSLEFTVVSDPDAAEEQITFNFRISGLADIDALRRYCEMVIAHTESGYLK